MDSNKMPYYSYAIFMLVLSSLHPSSASTGLLSSSGHMPTEATVQSFSTEPTESHVSEASRGSTEESTQMLDQYVDNSVETSTVRRRSERTSTMPGLRRFPTGSTVQAVQSNPDNYGQTSDQYVYDSSEPSTMTATTSHGANPKMATTIDPHAPISYIDHESLQCRSVRTNNRLDSCSRFGSPLCNDNDGVYGHEHLLCACHDNCVARGDCCHDFTDVCFGPEENPMASLGSEMAYCMETHKYYSVWTVNRCPPDWDDSDIKKNCEMTQGRNESVLRITPVIGQGGTVYENVYCARCHGVLSTDVIFTTLVWICQQVLEHIFDIGNGLARFVSDVKSTDLCQSAIRIPEANRSLLSKCLEVVDSCPPNTTSRDFMDFCRNHTSIVVKPALYDKNIHYKNAHCAVCNDVSISEIRCGIEIREERRRVPPLTVLFDFNDRNGQQITLRHRNRPDRTFQEEWTCDEDEIFDIISQRCVSFQDADRSQVTPNSCVEGGENVVTSKNALNTDHNNAIKYRSSKWILIVNMMFDLKTEFRMTILDTVLQHIHSFLFRNSTHERSSPKFHLKIGNNHAHAEAISTSLTNSSDDVNILTVPLCEYINETVSYLGQTISTSINVTEYPQNYCADGNVIQMQMNDTYLAEFQNDASLLGGLKSERFDRSRFLLSKRCDYRGGRTSGMKIDDLNFVFVCSESASSQNRRYINCVNGVVVKLARNQFEIRGRVLIHRALIETYEVPPEDYSLTDNGEFAIVCLNSKKRSDLYDIRSKNGLKNTVTLIGSTVSILCLLITIVTISIFPEMRSLPGKILLNLSIALALSQLIFITVMDQIQFKLLCLVTAIVSHYTWLTSFCWMSVMAFDISNMLRKKYTSRTANPGNSFRYYCIYAWLTPGIVVIGCVLVDQFAPSGFQIGYGEGSVCWIGRFIPLIVTFITPVGSIVLFNFSSFCFAFSILIRREKQMKMARQQTYTSRQCALAVKMSSAMGLTWIIAFVNGFVQSDILDYIFIASNTLQGVFIFIAFLLRLRTVRLYAGLCCKTKRPNSTKSSSGTAIESRSR